MMNKFYLEEQQIRLKSIKGKRLYSSTPIQTPMDAVKVMHKLLHNMDREYFCVINIDAKGHPINYNIVSIGELNNCTVSIPNVFKSAILCNAHRILVMHNHPSGSILPSIQDIAVTKKLISAGKLLNIHVADHIITGLKDYHYSFVTNHKEMFE